MYKPIIGAVYICMLILSTSINAAIVTLNPIAGGTMTDGISGAFDGTPDSFSAGSTGSVANAPTFERQFFAEFDLQGITAISSATLIYDLRYNNAPGAVTTDIYGYDASGLSAIFDRWDTLLAGESYLGTSPVTSIGTSTYSLDILSIIMPSQSSVGFRFQDVALLSGTAQQAFIDSVQLEIIGTVPIPSTVWLFGSGLLGLIGIARRKQV